MTSKNTFFLEKQNILNNLSNWLVATYNGFKEGLNWMNWRFLFGDQTSIISPFDPYQRFTCCFQCWVTWSLNLIRMPWVFFSNYHDPQRVWATKHLGFPGTSAATDIKHKNANWMVKLLNYRIVNMLLNLCQRNHHPFLSYPKWRIWIFTCGRLWHLVQLAGQQMLYDLGEAHTHTPPEV